MDKKLLVLVEIVDYDLLIDFLCIMKERPKIEQQSIEIPYISTSTWIPSKSKWSNINLNFFEEDYSKQKFLNDWLRLYCDNVAGRFGYPVGIKKNVIIKALDASGAITQKWTLIGTQIINFEINYDSYDKYKNIVLNKNIFRRKVLFEKSGNKTIELNCNLELKFDRAIIDDF